jgi:hypothetical protein
MEWLIAVLTWNGTQGKLLIQTEDDRLFPITVESIDNNVIREAIAAQFNIPVNRVIYYETKQTLYRKLTYMRYLVMED